MTPDPMAPAYRRKSCARLLDTPDPAASLTAGNVASGLKSGGARKGDAASGT